MLKNIERRIELADRVHDLLLSHERVRSVVPYGSIVDGRSDQYSDIDFRVEVEGISDRAFAQMVPGLLRPIGPYAIESWGPTALPERYIRVLYFADLPLFWHVDIWCESELHEDGSDIKAEFHWPFLFRVWLDQMKKVLRGSDDTKVMDEFLRGEVDIGGLPDNLTARLDAALDLIYENAKKKGAPCDELFGRLDAVRREYVSRGTVTV